MKNNLGLTDLIDCNQVRSNKQDDGSCCFSCGSNKEGWCSDINKWCCRARAKCEKSKAFEMDKKLKTTGKSRKKIRSNSVA